MRETTCHFCSDPILHVRVDRRATPDDWVSMPPGTFARLNPQPEPEHGWYVQGEEWFAFDPERYLSEGIRYTTHACSGGKP
jgi:hypothetical protein